MKKFVAIMMVLIMVICGSAFAEKSIPEMVSEALGRDYEYSGPASFFELLTGAEMLNNSVYILGVSDGWYIEYIDEYGTSYLWSNSDTPTHDEYITIGGTVIAMFECGYVYNCFINYKGESILLSKTYLGEENTYTDSSAFIVAFASLIAE